MREVIKTSGPSIFLFVSAFTCVVAVSSMVKKVARFLCLLFTLRLVGGAFEAIYGCNVATIYNGEPNIL